MREGNVQLFYFFLDEANSNIEYYKNVLLELSELVNNSVIIKSFVFRIEETENYKIIENLWNKRTGKLDLSNDIKRLLIREKCMSIYRAEFNLGETSWKEISIDEL